MVYSKIANISKKNPLILKIANISQLIYLKQPLGYVTHHFKYKQPVGQYMISKLAKTEDSHLSAPLYHVICKNRRFAPLGTISYSQKTTISDEDITDL